MSDEFGALPSVPRGAAIFLPRTKSLSLCLSEGGGFLLVALWSQGWRGDPTSVLHISIPLSPITRATVLIFSELGFAVSFRVCHLLIVLL